MPAGRPKTYTDDTVVALNTEDAASSRLNQNSLRRQCAEFLLTNNGQSTLAEFDEHFGYDVRETVTGLIRTGWLKVVVCK